MLPFRHHYETLGLGCRHESVGVCMIRHVSNQSRVLTSKAELSPGSPLPVNLHTRIRARMKPEGFRADTSTAISDYPDLIGDTTVILAKDRIVPDVIDNITDKAAFKVMYNECMVEPGMMLSINDIANEPKVEITQYKKEGVYALLMVDPDMPSPSKPEYKDVVVWMVCNIKKNDFDTGDFVVEYMGPEPGRGTHRYAMLLFEQPGFQKIDPPSKRAYFQTKQWTKEKNWEPVAGVYFKVKHGDA